MARGGAGNAAVATIAVALIGLLGTSVAAVFQWRTALELERTRQEAELAMEEQRFRSELILRAMQPEAEQARREFLTFLIKAGLVDGLDQALDYFAEDSPRILPRSEAEPSTAYSAFRSFMAGAIASGGSNPLADRRVQEAIRIALEGRAPERDRARMLLAEAGYPDGFRLTLLLNRFAASGGSREEAQILADKLRSVGINVALRG